MPASPLPPPVPCLNKQTDADTRNALAYILFSEGIPYIYYGTEAGYTTDREPLWHTGYSRQHPLWLFLRISVAYRKEAKVCVCVSIWKSELD